MDYRTHIIKMILGLDNTYSKLELYTMSTLELSRIKDVLLMMDNKIPNTDLNTVI